MSNFYPSKKNFKVVILIIVSTMIYQQKANAQTIKLIPNPDAGNKKGSDYIVFNNQLYTGYGDATGRNHLARWNGSELTVIPNPDNGGGFADYSIVFNNKLYFRYFNQSGKYQIAQYDGNTITLITNPDAGGGFNYPMRVPSPKPIIFNRKLYIQYTTLQATKLAVFDGTSLEIVLTQDSLTSYIGRPIIYNNKLYTGWFTKDFVSHLVEYDGLSFKIIANPDNGFGIADFSLNDIVTYPDPIIFNNKLYYPYNIESNRIQFELAQYDGTNLTLISNPDNSINTVGPWYNNFIVYNNKLCLNFYDSSNLFLAANKLGVFDGQQLSLVKNYDSTQLDPLSFQFIEYDNKLYFINRHYGQYYLTSYDGTKISEVETGGDLDMGIVYHTKLFYGSSTLAYYDGQNTTLINNLSNGAYGQYPFIFNDTLFFVYQSSITYHLAYLDDGTLAVNYLQFSAQLQNNNVRLQWQTAQESNTSFFYIQRSSDGFHFSNINKISAAGNSSNIESYSYTDAGVTDLNISKLFYRLQEVDKDGKSNYSSIRTVNFSNGHSLFSVSPNPSKDFINIVSSSNVSAAQVKITDISGKTLFTGKQDFVAGQQLKVSLSKFPGEVLIVTIVSDNNREQFKIIKE